MEGDLEEALNLAQRLGDVVLEGKTGQQVAEDVRASFKGGGRK